MIYITQLIYVKEGMESVFHEFEDHAIPILEKYKGTLLQRIRPSKDSIISGEEPAPYEIHFISFPSDNDLHLFMKDKSRQEFKHLKDQSVSSAFLVKGNPI